ncbi:MAG: ABC transporter permease subunit, partial [Vicinamibacterales bacterium]
MTRVLALLGKELADLARNRTVFFPAILTGVTAMIIPFFVAIVVPYFAGERLSDSSDFQVAIEMYQQQPGMRSLDPEAAIQAWIFQQFLLLLVLTPIAGAMSVAAYTVIGEKQARTLEPLLATPITTFELLAAKVLGSVIPAVGLAIGGFTVYVLLVWLFARQGVHTA